MHPYGSHERLQADAVMTASPQQLVVMLYDAAVRFGRQAAHALTLHDERLAFAKITRVEAILDELYSTLDMDAGGELAVRLQALYVWCRRMLSEARLERSPEKVGHVVRCLDELRDAFSRAGVAAPAVPA
jgi:flagellar secretion chaperone FliS